MPRSFRVKQIAGMFDLALGKTAQETFHLELPAADEPWQIGAIVGPSGSGKSSVARHAFAAAIYRADADAWPAKDAVVDGFDADVRAVTQTLTAVGFSSPPSWVKPYHVLSNGERFRCDLARALLSAGELVVMDEFTSVVDRTVARFGSAAVGKAIRSGAIQKRFVAVTCHYDVLDWLEADWVLDMATCELSRRRLRRPRIELAVAMVHKSAWQLFRRHHYLNTSIQRSAQCFAAFWDETPVAFSAWVRQNEKMREHRTVVLPDYQGLGIGNRLSEYLAGVWRAKGFEARSVTSHPAMLRHRSRSPLWRRVRLGMASPLGRNSEIRKRGTPASCSAGRVTGAFVYVGPPAARESAESLLAARPRVFRAEPAGLIVLECLRKYPGSSLALLSRLSGLTEDVTARHLRELVELKFAELVRFPRGRVRRTWKAVSR